MSNKSGASSSGESKNGKTIVSGGLRISGHLLVGDDVIIQISNISLITTIAIDEPKFPAWRVLLLLLAGFIVGNSYAWSIGIILIGCAGWAILSWIYKAREDSGKEFLHILLNSGNVYSILFKDYDFLNEVLEVFANIFEEGSGAKVNYYIDLDHCTVTDSTIVETEN